MSSFRKHKEILSHIITVSSVFLHTDSLKVLLICLVFTFQASLNTVILAFCYMILEETKDSDSKKMHTLKFSQDLDDQFQNCNL